MKFFQRNMFALKKQNSKKLLPYVLCLILSAMIMGCSSSTGTSTKSAATSNENSEDFTYPKILDSFDKDEDSYGKLKNEKEATSSDGEIYGEYTYEIDNADIKYEVRTNEQEGYSLVTKIKYAPHDFDNVEEIEKFSERFLPEDAIFVQEREHNVSQNKAKRFVYESKSLLNLTYIPSRSSAGENGFFDKVPVYVTFMANYGDNAGDSITEVTIEYDDSTKSHISH